MGWMFDLGPGGLAREDAPSAVPASRAIAAAPDTPAASVPAPAAAPDVQATPTASAPFEDRRTIAVLPFVNMSGDAENEYFSDGISEEILNLLTKLPQRSEEHTSELQSLMRISYAVFCLKKKKNNKT